MNDYDIFDTVIIYYVTPILFYGCIRKHEFSCKASFTTDYNTPITHYGCGFSLAAVDT